MAEPAVELRDVSVTIGARAILRRVSLAATDRQVLGVIGPSGAGKSTLLRAMNRLLDLVPGARVEGEIRVAGRSVLGRGEDVDALRARVGMLFQQPVVFPRSVEDNVLFGAVRVRALGRAERSALCEASLREAALWDEVKDRLREPAQRLSVGQQQRLCLARTLAVGPSVLLMDEPTSALDPASTEAIETLILRLRERHAVVLVTHDLAQARRVTDQLACLCPREGVGELVEVGPRDELLARPRSPEAIGYLSRAA